MITNTRSRFNEERGVAIVAVTILLATALLLVAIVTIETGQRASLAKHTETQVRAQLMALSGVERAIVELRDTPRTYDGSGMTMVASRRGYIIDPPDRLNDGVLLTSTGVVDGRAHRVRTFVAWQDATSGVFDKAIYAGNEPPDPEDQENPPPENQDYSLDFGGEDDEGDYVDGDVYSGNDVDCDDDAVVAPPAEESYVDANGNGKYDRGDYLTLDIDGNGVYDPGVSEDYTDLNGNGEWDLGEPFDDLNTNGQYDAEESYIDYDGDGIFDEAEEFVDENGNGRYDYGIEATGDVDYPDEPGAAGGDTPLAPPDLSGMDYAQGADVNVSERFSAIEAGTLPESNAAHIFRKNSSSTFSDVDETYMLDGEPVNPDDYFLEDPYESISVGDPSSDSGASRISIASESDGHEEGNDQVYFIDGNMWLHNSNTYSFKLDYPTADGIHVTFVVRGNITLSDNFYYDNMNNDQVAFIAMRREDDPKGEISGNVYMGDPRFGTVHDLHGLFYAENNFYDMNLDEEGSQEFTIYGNMTAGNQVDINRDYEVAGHYEYVRSGWSWVKVWVEGGTCHSSMNVIFDDRYVDGPNGRERLVGGLPNGPRRDSDLLFRVAAYEDDGVVEIPSEYAHYFGEYGIDGGY